MSVRYLPVQKYLGKSKRKTWEERDRIKKQVSNVQFRLRNRNLSLGLTLRDARRKRYILLHSQKKTEMRNNTKSPSASCTLVGGFSSPGTPTPSALPLPNVKSGEPSGDTRSTMRAESF